MSCKISLSTFNEQRVTRVVRSLGGGGSEALRPFLTLWQIEMLGHEKDLGC